MKHRICSVCKKDKKINNFYFDISQTDNHSYICNKCSSEKSKVRYQRNKQKRLQQMKKYNEANKERIKQQKAAWYQRKKLKE